jgi:hypothetical protein
MPIWTANDDPAGRPKYANTSDVYGVDATEARVVGAGVAPGWVKVTIGTGFVNALTVSAGGTGYTNADAVVIDGGAAAASVNATANVVVGIGANLAGTVAVTSSGANIVGTGTAFNTDFANGYTAFVYQNTTAFTAKKINQVVNATFMNITTTWAFTNASATYGIAGIIQSVNVTNIGAGFTTSSNVAITTTDGVGANLVVTLGGRAGRKSYESMVFINTMTGDAEDSLFPDT